MADTALPPLTGGCLCGAVRYEASLDDRKGYYCHCRMCQLAFGNTRAAYFNLRKAAVKWINAGPAYYASSKIARRGFCSTCGTPLSFEFIDSERMDLSVGSLDDPALLTPTEHFGIESRIAVWHVEDGLPGQRIDEFEAIMKRWQAAYGAEVVPGVEATRGR
jgi:hypothetical protein